MERWLLKPVTLSDRLRGIEGSPTLALAAKAKALAKAGKPIVDFTAGEPDAPTPEAIGRAGIAAIQSNRTKYTPASGIPELREAIARNVNATRGTSYQASHTIVTCGTKHALYTVFQALCQPGDEVVVFAPYWVSFPPIIRLSGATPVLVETREQDGFLPDPARLRAAVTKATKAVIVNSPSNPTGAVIDRGRLTAIAKLARECGFVIVSDEIYDQLVYPPARHTSVIEVEPGVVDQTVVVGGVSKSYSMTGWRIGWAVGPQPIIEAMGTIASHSTSNPTSISQYAALEALLGDQRPVTELVEGFHRRRDRMVGGLNTIPGCRCTMPGGAFYAWCNVSGFGQPAATTAAQWLEELFVATVPGDGFGAPEHIRFSFAASPESIDEGVKRLEGWAGKRVSAARSLAG